MTYREGFWGADSLNRILISKLKQPLVDLLVYCQACSNAISVLSGS